MLASPAFAAAVQVARVASVVERYWGSAPLEGALKRYRRVPSREVMSSGAERPRSKSSAPNGLNSAAQVAPLSVLVRRMSLPSFGLRESTYPTTTFPWKLAIWGYQGPAVLS